MSLDTDYNLNRNNGPQRGGNHLVSVHRLCEARFFKGGKIAKISKTSNALSIWASKFLADNLPEKPKQTRRLSYAEAWLAARREKMKMKAFGHYGDK